MKLYTEEQVKEMLDLSRLNVYGTKIYSQDELIEQQKPIELPSDEEIEKQSINIAHNYFDMLNTNHYQGLKDGSYKMAKWMKEQILNQNK